MEEGPIHRSCLTHTLASAPRGSFHAPIYLEPAITLSRKDWHSYVNGAVLSPSGQFALPAGGSSDKSAGLDQKGALGWGRFFVGADHARRRAFNQQGGLRPIVGQTQEPLPLLFGPSPGGPPEAISHLPRVSTAACGATRARQSELRRSERWRPPARRRTDVLWLDREAPSTSPPPMAPQVAHGKRGHLLILAPILFRFTSHTKGAR